MKNNDVLKIGSIIIWSTRWSLNMEAIARETKTMFITKDDRTRIYKKDNRIVGQSYGFARLATQKDFDAEEKRKLVRKLEDFDFRALPLAQLKEILVIVKNN